MVAPVTLTAHGKNVVGEVAIEVGPATLAIDRDRALDLALAGPLGDVARELDVILAAAPHRYARPNPGKGADGLTHFAVRGRVEGDRLMPDLHRSPAKEVEVAPAVGRRPGKPPFKKPGRRTGTAKPKRRS
jgi:hypothetical protein